MRNARDWRCVPGQKRTQTHTNIDGLTTIEFAIRATKGHSRNRLSQKREHCEDKATRPMHRLSAGGHAPLPGVKTR